MAAERPDLSQVEAEVVVYIEALEAELEELRPKKRRVAVVEEHDAPPAPLEPDEPPTTLNVITLSAGGLGKRTPRHLYSRQHRGGMGVFDLQLPKDDVPAFLIIADHTQSLIMITNQARAFRLAVNTLPETGVNGRGQPIPMPLSLRPEERLAVVAPEEENGYLNLLTARGHIRRFRYHFFGQNLRPGTLLYDLKELGVPAAACWSSGEGELFIATRQGRGIRFAERLVPHRGCLGIRLGADDVAVAITPTSEEGRLFLLSADGKGAVRLMAGFSPNKAPGTGGKVALKSDHLVGAFAIEETENILIISRLSKIIRFPARELPAKEGVVQGVHCMTLRADEVVAAVKAET
jgi:DNA gyrase subunit A